MPKEVLKSGAVPPIDAASGGFPLEKWVNALIPLLVEDPSI